jgi:hypothetical protein
MRKLLLGLAALVTANAASAAVVVDFKQGTYALPVGYTVFENFNGYANGQLLAGATNARAYTASADGIAARPMFNSTGGFGAALGGGPSSYIASFAETRGFSFVLGSLDTFNSLTLLYANNTQQTFTGAQIATGGDADGNQLTADSNGRVFYLAQAGDPSIVGAIFSSGGYSFEFDDLATLTNSAVPEPATWAMFLLAFGITGRAMRSRRKAAIPSFS